ncbi:FecR family protein [Sphingomonas sp. 10B4]|uniref:FecR family protein n=1 Tax=Sphingomonas sp. 10B4 TaxID=3048575 RepID=UPI002AB4336D|nr:FecR domain-containing protein [Sphingomonas sp. 10B4]MDY7526013.1 FecR domain-containing protein [Sphingomonas sp. 10B4]MEB0283748.1 FecR domain-containing protein [Sphingomonas sp. 10B4]
MNEDITERAAQWHAAQDADDMDWDGFAIWLEADPRHRAAFDRIALLDDDIVAQHATIVAHLAAPAPAQREPRRWRWRWAVVAGGALAAALALVVALPRPAADIAWQTGATARTIALIDGSSAKLAPHSRLVAQHGDQTQLALNGTAYFDVPHRADRTLSITAGRYRISDIGTRFDIAVDGATTRIAVAEGHIAVAAAGLDTPVTLVQGRALLGQQGSVTLTSIAAESVGSWRGGQLVYADAPLALVASDITRYAGAETTVDPAIANLRFSGALKIGKGTQAADALATIIGLEARHAGAGVRLERRRH